MSLKNPTSKNRLPKKIIRKPLLWLAIAYLLVGFTYAVSTPALEKHDEDGHYGFILYLREHQALPPLVEAPEGFAFEYKQPPLYYVVATALTHWLPRSEDPNALVTPNPYRPLSVPGHRNDNRNKFLHPPHMTPLILGARLVSLLFGLGTMLMAYVMAKRVTHLIFPNAHLVIPNAHLVIPNECEESRSFDAVQDDRSFGYAQDDRSFSSIQDDRSFDAAQDDRSLNAAQDDIPLATAAVVGFHPQFLYMATAINNDAATAFFGTCIITLLIAHLRDEDLPFYKTLLLGVCLGLACLTKVSGLVYLPLTGLALLLTLPFPPVFPQIRPRASRIMHHASRITYQGLIIITVAVLVGGWWYGRNALRYGDPLSLGTHGSTGPTQRDFVHRIAYDLFTIENTLWSNPAQTFVSRTWLGKGLIWWGRVSLGALILGIIYRAGGARHKESAPHLKVRLYLILLSWPVTFFLLLVFYWSRRYPWAYGRLLLPAIAPLGMLFVLGWTHLGQALKRITNWKALPRLLLTAVTSTLVIASALVPSVSIYPIYHPWHQRSAEQPIEHSTDILYRDPATQTKVAQLVGYGIPNQFVKAGEYLKLEVCLKPLTQTEIPYALFVHLLDLTQIDAQSGPTLWGARRTYPGLGNRPTDRWPLEEPFCDYVMVPVSSEAPTPLSAAIEIGFIDLETDKRLEAVGAGGEPIALAVVGRVPVVSQTYHKPVRPQRSDRFKYILDNAIAFTHAQVSTAPNGPLTLTLTWQCLTPVAYDATTFVHLKDAEGTVLSQVDAQPLQGRFPTSSWLAGQVITDVIRLPAPSPGVEDTALGDCHVAIGMYTWPSLERLPVADGAGTPQPENTIVISIEHKEVFCPNSACLARGQSRAIWVKAQGMILWLAIAM